MSGFSINLPGNLVNVPIFALIAEGVLVAIMLIIANIRKTARVNLFMLIGDAVFTIGTVLTLFSKANVKHALSTYTTILSFAFFLLIPYLVILCTFKPKKIEKLLPPGKAGDGPVQLDENGNPIIKLSEKEVNLFNVSKAFTAKASSCIGSPKGVSDYLDYINKSIKDIIKADGGTILLVDDFEDMIAVKAFDGDFPPPYELPADMPHKPVRIATNFKFAQFPLRENIFGEVATSGQAELITKPEKDTRIFQNGPEDFLQCGSYIFVPLKQNDRVIGVIAYARLKSSDLFTEEDLENAKTLSDFATPAIQSLLSANEVIENADMTKETEIASKIQNMMHPAKLPAVPGAQAGVHFSQASGVCGDLYDILISRKDRVSYLISDIAGKGMNSVLIMVQVRSMVRLVVNTQQSAGTILTWVNKGITGESYSTDHFGSTALINYNPEDSSIQVASAGVIPVLIYSAETGEVTELTEKTEPIGVEKSIIYKDFEQKVKTGDIIFTYTDGLVEALNENGQQYSRENLIQIVKDNHDKSGKDIANLVKADIKKFSGKEAQHDDQTLLVVKIQ